MVVFALGAAVNSLLVLPVLWLIRHGFDVVIPAGNVRGLILLGGAILVLRAASSALSLALRSHILHTVKGAITELRADLVAHMYGRSRAWFARTDPALLQTRIVQDTERLDNLANPLLQRIIAHSIPALLSTDLLP